MDVGCSGFFGIESCSVQDPYNIRGDRSVSGFDLTHVLSASATAPLPFGKGRRFANSGGWFDYIIGNWQLNGILTLTSGLPYNVFISSDIPNVGNFAPWSGNVRANQIGDPNLSNPGIGNGLIPLLLPRHRRLHSAIPAGIHFEPTGLRIWTCRCSRISLQ
jgi:hypothetical protein